MKKDDIQVTVSIKDGGFTFHTEGDSVLVFQAMMLGLAALLEDIGKDDTPDIEMEDLVLKEYRRAVVFVRENYSGTEASAEHAGEEE